MPFFCPRLPPNPTDPQGIPLGDQQSPDDAGFTSAARPWVPLPIRGGPGGGCQPARSPVRSLTSLVTISEALQSDVDSDLHFLVDTNVFEALGPATASRTTRSGAAATATTASGAASTRSRRTRRDAARPGHGPEEKLAPRGSGQACCQRAVTETESLWERGGPTARKTAPGATSGKAPLTAVVEAKAPAPLQPREALGARVMTSRGRAARDPRTLDRWQCQCVAGECGPWKVGVILATPRFWFS